MQRLSLPDGEIAYEARGDGPSVLLLHAGVADARMWDPQMDALAASCRVVRADLRGFGRSPLPDGPFAHHEDVATLLAALDLAPALLVGASFGGGVAVDVALAHPSLVRALVLVAPAVGGFIPSDAVRAFGDREDELLEAGRFEEATELNLRMWVDGPRRGPDAVDAAVRAKVGEMQLHAFRAPTPDGASLVRLDPPAIGRLGDLDLPVLVVAGALDEPSFVALAEGVAERAPRGRYVEVPGAAHMLTMERPEAFAALVLDAL